MHKTGVPKTCWCILCLHWKWWICKWYTNGGPLTIIDSVAHCSLSSSLGGQLPCWELHPPCQTYDICSCCSRTSQPQQQMSINYHHLSSWISFGKPMENPWFSPWCSQVLWKTRFLKRRIPRNSANRGRSMLQWLHSRRRHQPVLAVGFRWRASYLPTYWIGDDRGKTPSCGVICKTCGKNQSFFELLQKVLQATQMVSSYLLRKDCKPCRKTWDIFQHTVTTHYQSIRLNSMPFARKRCLACRFFITPLDALRSVLHMRWICLGRCWFG